MNYKEMLDMFDFLEKKVAYLENELKFMRERVLKLEGSQTVTVEGPSFTTGTLPTKWPVNLPATMEFNSLAKFDFDFKNLNNPKGTPNEG